MYGNTENAASVIAGRLSERGVQDMRMYDVSKTHPSYVISDIFKYSNVVFASSTYNMHLYFMMDSLLRELGVLGIRNIKVSLIGNHSWASAALKGMKELIDTMKDIEIVGTPMDIKSTLKIEQEADLDQLADEIAKSLEA